MRKPRDFDAELKTLGDKARQLKDRKIRQLGELVIATNADAIPLDQLAGALLSVAETTETKATEAWRKRGAAFFQRTSNVGGSASGNMDGGPAGGSGASPDTSADRP
jgi:hypothetical protein